MMEDFVVLQKFAIPEPGFTYNEQFLLYLIKSGWRVLSIPGVSLISKLLFLICFEIYYAARGKFKFLHPRTKF